MKTILSITRLAKKHGVTPEDIGEMKRDVYAADAEFTIPGNSNDEYVNRVSSFLEEIEEILSLED